MSDYEDPAWDEYLSTGEDPTGGDLDDEIIAIQKHAPLLTNNILLII